MGVLLEGMGLWAHLEECFQDQRIADMSREKSVNSLEMAGLVRKEAQKRYPSMSYELNSVDSTCKEMMRRMWLPAEAWIDLKPIQVV